MPTEKQVRYILYLLHHAGYSTNWMNARFKALGATMRERSGHVEDWVRALDYGRASELIDISRHEGVHPRVGSADVTPFVPLEGASMQQCIDAAHHAGRNRRR